MDKKHTKKIKRDKKKKREKKAASAQDQHLTKQMNMFDRLPDKCSACNETFPQTREAHMSWQVTVYNERQVVRLFCPSCQEKAKKLVEGEEG
tara:strand:- start:1544 stop:1819 length:276 start_codon:yes stop_codon:yes gene_type:complete